MYDKSENVNIIAELIKKRIKQNEEKMLDSELKNESGENRRPGFDLHSISRDVNDINQLWEVDLPASVRSNRRFIGKLIVLIKRAARKLMFWYISPPIRSQKMFNASATRSINGLFQYARTSQKEIDELKNSMNQIIGKINNLESFFANEFSEIKASMDQQKQDINVLTQDYHNKIEMLNLRIQANKDAEEKLEKYNDSQINHLKELININSKDLEYIRAIQHDIIKNLSTKRHENSSKNEIENSSINIDYLDFENYFRGSEEDISGRMEFYTSYFAAGDIVLDIGCGRGEFLQLLKNKGITGVGIDADLQMVEVSRTKGLDIYLIDALEYLSGMPDNHFNGIFLGQVVEHLEPNYLIDLLELAYSKLKQNGRIIIETQNPMCLYIYAYWFYVDMSHIKPVHPYTMKYLLDSKQFKDTEIIFRSPVPTSEGLELINNDHEDTLILKLNENFAKINKLLFGYQDYAIIGKK